MDKKKKKKKKKNKKKHSSLLSFGNEEEERNAFVLKKKKRAKSDTQELLRSRKRARAKQKLRQQRAKEAKLGVHAHVGPRTLGKQENQYSNLMSSKGMYTPEALHALKSNAIHMKSKSSRRPKPAEAKETPASAKRDTAESGALIVPGDRSLSLSSKSDQDMAKAAREKRSRLRARGESYISLRNDRTEQGLTTTIGGREYTLSNSTEHGGLVTEDGEDDVEDYIQGHSRRIQFGQGANTKKRAIGSLLSNKKKGKKKTGINSLLGLDSRVAMEEDDEEESEMRRWEESLSRAGGGNLRATSHRDLMYRNKKRAGAAPSVAAANVPAAPQPPRNVTMTDIKRALKDSLTEIKDNAAKKERHLVQLRTDIEAADSGVINLEEKLDKLNQKYLFFQTTRDQFSSLLDCLKAKTKMIDGAWEELIGLRKKYAKFQREQKDLHLQDEVREAWGDPPPSSPKLDEFGRDVNFEAIQGRERRAKEREEKRAAVSSSDEPEGWTEPPAAAPFLERDYHSLVDDAKLIFQDVVARYASLEFARDKMQHWKTTYPQLYEDAYIGLSGPSVFAPYIRLQLIEWDPLQKPTFDGMAWYGDLFDFGVVEGMKDDDVVPRVVDKLVVPVIIEHYRCLWNPFDPQSTTQAISVFKEAVSHLLDDAAGFGALRTGVVQRLTGELKAHAKLPVLPTQSPHRSAPAAGPEEAKQRRERKLAFCRRRWWSALKLFTQIARWLHVDTHLDKDILDIMLSLWQNSLLPFIAYEAQRACDPGGVQRDSRLLPALRRMASRLVGYLPAYSAERPDAKLSQLTESLRGVTQLSANPQQMQQGLVLNKLRAILLDLLHS